MQRRQMELLEVVAAVRACHTSSTEARAEKEMSQAHAMNSADFSHAAASEVSD